MARAVAVVRAQRARRSGAGRGPTGATRRPTIRECSSASATRPRRPGFGSSGQAVASRSGRPSPIDRYTTLTEGSGRRAKCAMTNRAVHGRRRLALCLCSRVVAVRRVRAAPSPATSDAAAPGLVARPLARGGARAGAAARALRVADAENRKRRHAGRRAGERIRRDGQAAHGGGVSRRGRALLPQCAGARAGRRALAVLSRAPLPAQGRACEIRDVLRAGPPAAAGRCGRAGLARRPVPASRPAGGGRAAVHEGADRCSRVWRRRCPDWDARRWRDGTTPGP